MRRPAGRSWFGRKPTREPVQAEEAGWAAQDVALWNGRGVSAEKVAAEAERAAASLITQYRIDIAGPSVRIAPKAEIPELSPPFRMRAEAYRRVLEEVVRLFGIDIRAPLLLDTNDTVVEEPETPIFGFQRMVDQKILLLPDIDLMHGFNVQAELQDRIPWRRKADGAIFTGSTSGGFSTEESVRERRLPRLAAAEHFRNSPRVRWELPGVVQYASPAVADLIRSLGFGGERRTWADQFAYKVLLSMDGNGATCSRVSIGLASNCVLAKFQSPHVLHYFRAMAAGEHYVSLSAFEDVDRMLDDLEARPERYEAIARGGQAFAHRHLTRIATYTYTAELLIRYDQLLRGETVSPSAARLAHPVNLVELVATFDDGARRLAATNGWAGAPRSRRPITALALHAMPGTPVGAITLSVVDASGAVARTTPTQAEVRAADGGALYGAAIELDPSYAETCEVELDLLFVDGRHQGDGAPGAMAASPSQAPLEAVRLSVRPR